MADQQSGGFNQFGGNGGFNVFGGTGMFSNNGGEGGSGIPLQPETEALLAEFDTTPPQYVIDAINKFIFNSKERGNWSGYDFVTCLALDTESNSLFNWKNTSGDKIEKSETGITWSAFQGFTGDGESGFLNTKFTPSSGTPKYSLNSAHMGVYVLSTIERDGAEIGASMNLGIVAGSGLSTNRSDGSARGIINTVSGPETEDGSNLSQNIDCIRSEQFLTTLYENGISMATDDTQAAIVPTVEFYILANNLDDAAVEFSQKQLSFSVIGKAPADIAGHNTDVQTLLTELGVIS